jgi:hypothetical protein
LIELGPLVATIRPAKGGEQSLLGMSVLRKFGTVTLQADQLIIAGSSHQGPSVLSAAESPTVEVTVEGTDIEYSDCTERLKKSGAGGFAAIAFSHSAQSFGVAENSPSRRFAECLAFARCKIARTKVEASTVKFVEALTGEVIHQDCSVVGWVANGCVSMAKRSGQFGGVYLSGPKLTSKAADAAALKNCGKYCHIETSVCAEE